jgi:hypothetical protein
MAPKFVCGWGTNHGFGQAKNEEIIQATTS